MTDNLSLLFKIPAVKTLEALEWDLDQILLRGEFGEPETADKMCELFERFLTRLLYFGVYDERLREIIAKASAELNEPARAVSDVAPALDIFNVNMKRANSNERNT